MKKYHFVKIAEVRNKQKGSWYFKPESVDDVMEHWHKYVGAVMRSGAKELFDQVICAAEGKICKHSHSYWAETIKEINALKNEPIWKTATEIENELLQNRLKMMCNGDEIYLSDELTVFMLTDGITEVVDEVYSDTLVYPSHDYHIEDVRYIQWPGGYHWYAKIGNMDIVYEQGNQKWNTRKEAELAVYEYFKKNLQ